MGTNMLQWNKSVSQAAILLMGFALVSVLILAFIHEMTATRIAKNEHQALIAQFNHVIAERPYNNQPLLDKLTIPANDLNSAEPVILYRARQDNVPVAAVFMLTTLQGYNGSIRLLIGIDPQQQLTGVRVLSHKETPGLGDRIEVEKSDWIQQFNGRSLQNPTTKGWAVRKDGGEFDQFTGATITPRAIVSSVYDVLQWSQSHATTLFQDTATPLRETNE